ncbi:MAG TPA: hypothetical protein PKJ04_00500 [Nitrospira sp.]|nr:hypothetical protein [Nitrospira sp.]MBS0176961.1 hypothetical protein [Nitrospira sp.]MCW5781024.1 hypothetical protein [Nitrospira sp.]HMZ54571.1 hypothetical protein [Nitrospira sp.]HNA27812.1 hypothetical protein [Nitrospira sp.]
MKRPYTVSFSIDHPALVVCAFSNAIPIEPYHTAHVSIQVSPVRDSFPTVTEERVASLGMEELAAETDPAEMD